MQTDKKYSPIAIVGFGAMFPGRGTTAGFWRDIVEGVNTIRDIPETHWRPEDFYDADPSVRDKTYSRHGGFIPHFAFDPLRFGTPPQVVETTDTVQLMALYVARQVLEDAQKTQFQSVDPARTSVVLGVAAGTEMIGDMASRLNRPMWMKAMREQGLSKEDAEAVANRIGANYTEWRESTFPGLLGNVVAGRIANRFDLGGSNFTTDAACASSLAAIRHAAQELWLGESDMVLAGGADALNNIFMYMCFSKTPAMSASGVCRPFSADSDGTLMGEGCGIFALRRVEDAERDGNRIYAVLTGLGASSDGKGTAIYAPRSGGQAVAVERAFAMAGYSPRTVELMEAHGTGTRVGDATEFAGLKAVFEAASKDEAAWCALGSVKSQIGHTKSAAGAASLAKAVAALHHKVLPPTINVSTPNPKLGIEDSPFYLGTVARPWIRGLAHPRRVSISSFGFGGSNFHLTAEEYLGKAEKPKRFRTMASELFLFSAPTSEALVESFSQTAAACRHADDLAHYAFASQTVFDFKAPHRLAVTADSVDSLNAHGEKVVKAIRSGVNIATEWFRYSSKPAERNGKVAFLFAGQGSQYVGMGASLAVNFDRAREPWDKAADYAFLGLPRLHDIAFPAPAFEESGQARQNALLTQTENAQPCIGLVALSHLNMLSDLKLTADCFAGHSFGEIMALHAAGALNAEAAIALARARGLASAQASQKSPGTMLAVFAGRSEVERHLDPREDLVFANDNAQNQVVLSGSVEAIAKIEGKLSKEGMRVQRLNVSAAFHSPLVKSATVPLRAAIDASNLQAPLKPVYANATAAPYPANTAAARDLLTSQLASEVRFRETVEAMYRDGVRVFVEVGPSNVLSRFAETILGDRPHFAVSLDHRKHHGTTALNMALGGLCVAGVPVNLAALWTEAPAEPPRAEVKKHEILLNGANYNKPYPGTAISVNDGWDNDKTLQALHSDIEHLRSVVDRQVAAAAAVPVMQPVAQPMTAAQFVAAPARVEIAKPAAASGAAYAAVGETVRAVVADKTGYPTDMLDMGMDLEAELGIDSIKQVEILSALRERLPQMPEIEPSRLSELRTLAQIAAAIAPAGAVAAATVSLTAGAASVSPAAAGSEIAISPVVVPSQTVTPAAAISSAAYAAVAETVRAVVADKTGYPTDMLDMGMDLEAELGIDSIKQVEILSALRERLPQMPEIEPSRLSELRTLAQIAAAITPAGTGAATTALNMAPVAGSASVSPMAARAEITASPAIPQPVGEVVTSTAATSSAAYAAVAETVRAVVADKTGYPTDMLDMGMDLEAELGIDSIKQVEILSALRERLPQMPEIEPSRLSELRTLAQIASAIAPAGAIAATPLAAVASTPLAVIAPVAAVLTPAVTVPAVRPVHSTAAVSSAYAAVAETVRAVVADKTGYPTDMLDMGMDLEAELGIDSIKQVEILSALRERLPQMPEIEPSRLSELRTLAQIALAIAPADPVAKANTALAADAASASFTVAQAEIAPSPAVALPLAETVTPAAAVSSAAYAVVAETVRAVVADKTGYPTDMLDMGMDLEAELGIDSIKQVEILSALRERLPQMPEIEPSRLSELRTLAQIAAAIAPADVASTAAAGHAAAATKPVGGSQPVVAVVSDGAAYAAVAETVRAVVADKTGYPTDMLDMGMDLEAELGIDSIKQVEILSALRERLPQMPEIEPSRLSELRTLAQIALAIAPDGPVAAQVSIPIAKRDTSDFEKAAAAVGLFRQAVRLAPVPLGYSRPYPMLSNASVIEITAHAGELAQALKSVFEQHGLPARIVETPSEAPDLLVVTAGCDRRLDGLSVHRQALLAAKTVAGAMTERGGRCILLQSTGGDFGHSARDRATAERGGLTALAKTAAHEWPKAMVRAIDIGEGNPRDDAFVARVGKEILFGGDAVEIALAADGRRLGPVVTTEAYPGTGIALKDGDVIVVSGGARSITASVVCRLAKEAKLKFLLLGRSKRVPWPAGIKQNLTLQGLRFELGQQALLLEKKPSIKEISAQADQVMASREIDETIAAIRALGSDVEYVSVDISDATSVRQAIDAYRKTVGRIAGVIHGAGVNMDKLIKDKTPDQLQRVFQTKIDGFNALWSAVGSDRPGFVVLFSSIAGRFGNPGQSDYAMANEVMSRMAWSLQNQHPDTRFVAIDWGAWLGGMVTDGVRAQFEERGIPLIPVEIGVEALLLELVAGGSNMPELVFAGLPEVMLAESARRSAASIAS